MDRLPDGARRAGTLKGKDYEDDGTLLHYLKSTALHAWRDKPARNAAIRATFRYPPGGAGALSLRNIRKANLITAAYELNFERDGLKLYFHDIEGQSRQLLQRWDYPPGFDPSAEHSCEFRAVDDLLTAGLDGRKLGSVHDKSLDAPGDLTVSLSEGGTLRAFELLRLDPPAGGNPTPAAAWPAPVSRAEAPEPWQDLFADPALFTANELIERTSKGALLKGGFANLPGSEVSDSALRVSFVWNGNAVNLHARKFEDRDYVCAYTPPGQILIQRHEGGRSSTLLKRITLPTPLDEGSVGELEFRLVGTDLRATWNGLTVIQCTDDHFTKGTWAVSSPYDSAPVELHSLQYLKLGAPTQAEGVSQGGGVLSATVTKGAAFINSLGMKFVPVPITGGPTDKQRVLFSIWETRVQDYELFAKETKREWHARNIPEGPTHPAVNVSHEDAEASASG